MRKIANGALAVISITKRVRAPSPLRTALRTSREAPPGDSTEPETSGTSGAVFAAVALPLPALLAFFGRSLLTVAFQLSGAATRGRSACATACCQVPDTTRTGLHSATRHAQALRRRIRQRRLRPGREKSACFSPCSKPSPRSMHLHLDLNHPDIAKASPRARSSTVLSLARKQPTNVINGALTNNFPNRDQVSSAVTYRIAARPAQTVACVEAGKIVSRCEHFDATLR